VIAGGGEGVSPTRCCGVTDYARYAVGVTTL
jgi:hypothetical protein